MPLSLRRPGARLLPCLVVALVALTAILAPRPAAAQPALDRFHAHLGLFADRDGSGDASCGDHVAARVFISSEVGSFDLTNLTVHWQVPENTRIVPGHTTLGFGEESDCRLVSGTEATDRDVVATCSFLCRTGGDGSDGTCTQVGLDLHTRLEIVAPNDATSFQIQAVATADQIVDSVSDAVATPAPNDPATFFYRTCPPAAPAALAATLDDTLHEDLDGDRLAEPGDAVGYQAVVSNPGGSTAPNVVLSIPRPDHTSFLAGALDVPQGSTVESGTAPNDPAVVVRLGDLPAGASRTVRYALRVHQVPLQVDRIVSQGLVESGTLATVTDDPTTFPSPDETITFLHFDPDLELTKTADPTSAPAGSVARFRLAYRNLARGRAGDTRLHETVPPHTTFDQAHSTPGWSCPDGSPPGTACELVVGGLLGFRDGTATFGVRVAPRLPAGVDSTTNVATVGHNGTDRDPSNQTASAGLQLIAAPALELIKSGPATARPGDLVAYTLTAANSGDRDAAAATLHDQVPMHTRFDADASSPGWTCPDGAPPETTCTLDLGTLAAGGDATATFAVRVDATLPAGATHLTNTALLRDAAGTPPAQATATTALDAAPRLVLDKRGPDAAAPGDLIVFILRYANTGDRDATGVDLTDIVPAHTTFAAAASSSGWSCPDLAPADTACTLVLGLLAAGEAGEATFAVRLAPTVPADLAAVRNTAVLTGDPDDPPGEDETEVPVDAAPDLRLTKTGPPAARPGDLLAFTLAYENAGTRDAPSVSLTDTVPAHTTFAAAGSTPGWSCPDGAPAATPCTLELGPLPAGATGSATFAVHLAATVPATLAVVRNTAVLTGGPDDPSGEDDVEVPVDAAPDLRLTKTGPPAARPGDLLAFTLAYENAGTRDAPSVILTDTVPAHTTFAAAGSTPGWSCPDGAPAGTDCTLDVGPLPAGATGSATFAVHLAATVPATLAVVRNTAVLTGGPDDPPGEDDVEVPVDAAATLLLDKRGPATAHPGDLLAYTLAYSVAGGRAAPGATLTDTVPPATTFAAADSSPAWSCPDGAPAGTACTLPLGDLAPGATGTATFAVRLAAGAPAGDLDNTATLADTAGDPPASDDATTTVAPPPPTTARLAATLIDTFLEDVDGDGRLGAGDVLNYTAAIENLGPAPAQDVRLTLAPDPNTTLLPGHVTTTRGQIESGHAPGDTHLAVSIDQLAPGDTAAVTLEVRLDDPLPLGLDEIVAQGDLTATNAPATVTDDPDTARPLDPTVTPLGDAGPPAIVEVPTLHTLGLAALATLLAAAAFRRLALTRKEAR